MLPRVSQNDKDREEQSFHKDFKKMAAESVGLANSQNNIAANAETMAGNRTNVLATRMEEMGVALKEGFNGLTEILTPIATSLLDSATDTARDSIRDGKERVNEFKETAVTTADDFIDDLKDFIGEFSTPLLALVAIFGLAIGTLRSYVTNVLPNALKGLSKLTFTGLRAWPAALSKALGLTAFGKSPIGKSIMGLIDGVVGFFDELKMKGIKSSFSSAGQRLTTSLNTFMKFFVTGDWLPKFLQNGLSFRRNMKHLDNVADIMSTGFRAWGKVADDVPKVMSKFGAARDIFVSILNGLKSFGAGATKLLKLAVPIKTLGSVISDFIRPLTSASSGMLSAFKVGLKLASKIAWPITVIMSAFRAIGEFSKEFQKSGDLFKSFGAALAGIFDVIIGDLLKLIGSISNKILTFFGLDAFGNRVEKFIGDFVGLLREVIMAPFDGLSNIVSVVKGVFADGWSAGDLWTLAKLAFTTIRDVITWPFRNVAKVMGLIMGGGDSETTGDGFFSKAWAGAKGLGMKFLDAVKELILNRVKMFMAPMKFVKNLFNGKGEDVASAANNITEGAGNAVKSAKEYMSGVGETMSGFGSSILDGLKGLANKKNDLKSKALNAAGNAGNAITKRFTEFVHIGRENTKEAASGMFTAIGDKLGMAVDNSKNKIKKLKGKFNIGGLVKVGRSLMEGYFSLIKDLVAGAATKLNSIKTNISSINLESVVVNLRQMMGQMLMQMLPTTVGTTNPIVLDGLKNDVKSAFGMDGVVPTPSSTRQQADNLETETRANRSRVNGGSFVNAPVVAPTNISSTQNVNTSTTVRSRSQTIVNSNL